MAKAYLTLMTLWYQSSNSGLIPTRKARIHFFVHYKGLRVEGILRLGRGGTLAVALNQSISQLVKVLLLGYLVCQKSPKPTPFGLQLFRGGCIAVY